MKKSTLVVALSAALLSMSAAQASEFAGGFLGLKAGQNRSDISRVDCCERQERYYLWSGRWL